MSNNAMACGISKDNVGGKVREVGLGGKQLGVKLAQLVDDRADVGVVVGCAP